MKHQNYGPRLGKLVHQSSRGHNFGIWSLFGAHNTSLEIFIHYKFWCEQHWSKLYVAPIFSKKLRLGAQNIFGSSGPEKNAKIVSCAETEKLKETMVGPQVE